MVGGGGGGGSSRTYFHVRGLIHLKSVGNKRPVIHSCIFAYVVSVTFLDINFLDCSLKAFNFRYMSNPSLKI